MSTACLTYGSHSANPSTEQPRRQGRGTIGVQTEQELIRTEYLELSFHLHGTEAERGAVELHAVALRMRCTHPSMGRGTLPGCWKPVGPNQCPDCGFVTEMKEMVTPSAG